MTIYARSDLASVSVSAAHGGCGETHTRPAPGGNPVEVWGLDCPRCADYLRSDPLWSTTVSEIPETLDEELARKDFEKRGAMDERRIMTLAMAKLAGLELPETISAALTGAKRHIPASMVCPQGHENAPGQKFCGECGASMHSAPPERQIASPAPSQRPQEPSQARGEGDASRKAPAAPGGLSSLHPQKLRKMCRDAGLSDSGKVPDLVARLEAAGVQAPA